MDNLQNKSKDPVLREKELDGYRAIAQKIRNRLQQLENATEADKRRWIWELIQNAVDAADGEQVCIKVTINNNYVRFEHNGGVFSPRNVTSLVHQISSKEGTDLVGRFGTGFLTTHTLSRKVQVEGVNMGSADERYRFYLTLNRTGNTERELMEGIEEAWDSYKRELLDNPQPPFWTCFTYLEPNLDVAKATLHDFETFLHISLAFVPNIASIVINNEIENYHTTYTFKSKEQLTAQIELITCEVVNDDQTTSERRVFHVTDSQVGIAIPVSEQDGKVYIQPIAKNVPRVFVAYPLIGTEDFYFPFVVNSRAFNPTTERDMLYLKGETGVAVKNKQLLLTAVSLYKIALSFIAEHKWKNTYEVCKHKLPPENEQFDAKWYKENVIPKIQTHLLTLPIVETNDANKYLYINKQPNNTVYFPVDANKKNREAIWRFLHDLYPNYCSKQEQIHEWYEIVKNWDACNRQNIELMMEDVERQENLNSVAEQLAKDTDGAIVWLNDFIAFVETVNPELLAKYAILPNQQPDGIFKTKSVLYEDKDKVPDVLKDVLLELGEDWRETYLHTAITTAQMNGKVRWLSSIVQAINAIIERNELYKFTQSSYQKLKEKFTFNVTVDNGLQQLIGKGFNEKSKYQAELRKIFANQLHIVEDTILANSKDDGILKAALTLTSLINPGAKEEDLKYRNEFYQLTKAFYQETPEITHLPNLPIITWAKSDRWLVKSTIQEIEALETIVELSRRLLNNAETQSEQNNEHSALLWLNSFFHFVVQYQFSDLLSNNSVYPNQIGVFCTKTTLFADAGIPNQFKDVLASLENSELTENDEPSHGWRDILLDTSITAFQEKLAFNAKMVKDISEKISTIIRNTKHDAKAKIRNIILNLLSLSQTPTPAQQRKVWEFARSLYFDNVPERITQLSDVTNFNWEACINWVVNRLIIDIASFKFTEILQNELHGNLDVIDWLNRVISFLAENQEFKHLLDSEDYPIIPNQNGSLCRKSGLYIDDEIPKELKEILSLLHYEWIDELLHTDIMLDLPPDRVRTYEDAAEAVDKTFKNYVGSKQEPDYVKAWRIFEKWAKIKSEEELKSLFDWIQRHKAEIALAIIGEEEQKNHIYEIIQSGNAHVFAQLANGLSADELMELADNPKEYKIYLQWRNNNESINFTDGANVLLRLNEATGNNYTSIDELIAQLNVSTKRLDFAQEDNKGGGNINFEALARANDEAKEKVYIHLQQLPDYDISNWTRESNTIISGVKKKGIDIKLVVKAANKGIIYFDKAQKEQSILTDTFSELWVHNEGKVFLISLGDIIKEWNVKSMRAYLFDFK